MAVVTSQPGQVASGPQPRHHPVIGKWAWFVALGILLLALGLLAFANVMLATFASVAFIGGMMFVGGVFQIIHAFQVRQWGAFAFWLLSGLLYAGAGILAFYNPVLAAGALTLAIAAALIVAGAMRIGVGLHARPLAGWGWVVASGVLTLLVGLIIALGWPANALWILGLFLAVDLTYQGAMALAFGLALKARV